MDIEITIRESKYFSSMDQAIFYECLESISAVKSVKGNSGGLGIFVTTPIGKDDFHELTSLFRRYSVSLSYLNELLKYCNCDKKLYYDHKDIYGELFKKIKNRNSQDR